MTLDIQHSQEQPDPISMAGSDAKVIDAHNYRFRYTLDKIFEKFTQLETLNLSYCGITKLPISLFALNSLKQLDISHNVIEQIPFELGSMQNLQELDVSNNPFAVTLSKECELDSGHLIPFLRKLVQKNPKPQARTFAPIKNPPKKNGFMLLSYNILAPYCVRPDRFPFSPPKYLNADQRIALIEEQIIEFPVSIVCLQEVEGSVYKEKLEPFMHERGFHCTYCQKGRAEKLNEAFREMVHGQATFVRNSHLTVIKTECIQYRNMQQAQLLPSFAELKKHDETAIISIVQHKSAPNLFIAIVNIHLYWEQTGNDDVRTSQLYLALEAAKNIVKQHSSNYDIIIAGDFNSESQTTPHRWLVQNGFFDVYDSFGLSPRFTIYGASFHKTIDFIYSTVNKIRPISILQSYNEEEILQRYVAFPHDYFPSDHLPIVACFAMPKKNHTTSALFNTIQIDKPEKTPCTIAIGSGKSAKIVITKEKSTD